MKIVSAFRQKRYQIILALFLGLIGFILLMPFLLNKAGLYLTHEDSFRKADIAIVLAGCNGERIRKGAELYKSKKVPMLIMSGGGVLFDTFYTTQMADYAVRLGIPRKNIIEEKNSLSTYESAKACYPILKKIKSKKIVIVTSKFHTRRSLVIFTKVFQGSGVRFYMVSAEDQIDYNHWWQHHEMAEKILIEWAKTIVYWGQYGI